MAGEPTQERRRRPPTHTPDPAAAERRLAEIGVPGISEPERRGSFLRRAFVENAGLKLVALILAVTLFIVVRGDEPTERVVLVGLAVVKPEDRALVSEIPPTVQVSVRGPWTKIRRLDPDSIDPIVLDLTKVSDGDVILGEEMIRLPPGLEVTAVDPPRLRVQFEGEKRVPVAVAVVGQPARGHKVEKVTVTPDVLRVRGERRALDRLVEAKTQVGVSGRTESFRVRVPLDRLPEGADAHGVTEVDVDVQIGEEILKQSATRPVTVRRPGSIPAPAAAQLEIEPKEVLVVLRGGRDALAQVDLGKLTPFVQLLMEDVLGGAPREAPVILEGLAADVAVELHPRTVQVRRRLK